MHHRTSACEQPNQFDCWFSIIHVDFKIEKTTSILNLNVLSHFKLDDIHQWSWTTSLINNQNVYAYSSALELSLWTSNFVTIWCERSIEPSADTRWIWISNERWCYESFHRLWIRFWIRYPTSKRSKLFKDLNKSYSIQTHASTWIPLSLVSTFFTTVDAP